MVRCLGRLGGRDVPKPCVEVADAKARNRCIAAAQDADLNAGQSDPVRLAELAQGTARHKSAELREALRGRITEHHRTTEPIPPAACSSGFKTSAKKSQRWLMRRKAS
jgi:hypothetical protein